MHTARNVVREAGVRYKRHQPAKTLLYQIIETLVTFSCKLIGFSFFNLWMSKFIFL